MSPYVEVLDLLVHVVVRSCACKDDRVNFKVLKLVRASITICPLIRIFLLNYVGICRSYGRSCNVWIPN